MTAITLRGLWARKLRAGLTALAVAARRDDDLRDLRLHGHDQPFVRPDLRHREQGRRRQGRAAQDDRLAGSSSSPPFSQSLLARVRSAKGVAKAAGGVNDSATVFNKQRQARQQGGGAGAACSRPRPSPSTRSRYARVEPPANANEVTLDTSTADKHGFEVGDIVLVGGRSCPRSATGSPGSRKFGDVSVVRRSDDRRPHAARGAAHQPEAGSWTRSTSRSPSGASTRTVTAELRGAAAPDGRRQDRRPGREGPGERHPERPQLPQHAAARVRRDRALRRRLHHLQHLLDHGRAAHDRVRPAAHDGRLAAADHALGPARSAHHRARRVDRRPVRRDPRREGHHGAVQGIRHRPALTGDGAARAHGDRLAAGRHDRDGRGGALARAARDARAAARGHARRRHARRPGGAAAHGDRHRADRLRRRCCSRSACSSPAAPARCSA